MLMCRYDKDANLNLCAGCSEGCITVHNHVNNKKFSKVLDNLDNLLEEGFTDEAIEKVIS